MTELSGFWTTSGTPSGDQQASYTQAQLAIAHAIMAACSGFEGVAPGYANKYACSDGGANTVDVATGGAMVDGLWVNNDAVQNINIPSAVGGGNSRIDRIVLRADWANFNVSVHRIAGTDAGSPTAPSITQTSGTTYDIQLCQVLVDTSGNVTVTDERTFAQGGTNSLEDDAVTTAKIADSNVTLAKMAANSVDSDQYVDGSIDLAHMSANSVDSDQYVDGSIDTAHLANDAVDDTKVGDGVPALVNRQGGSATIWDTYGTTDYTTTAVRMQVGKRTGEIVNGLSGVNITVTFPAAFSYAPICLATVDDSFGHGGISVVIATVSASTVTFRVNRGDTSGNETFFLAWLAIGPE